MKAFLTLGIAGLLVAASGTTYGGDPDSLTATRAINELNSPVQSAPMPAAAGDVINQAPYAGGAGLGMTLDTATDTVIGLDLFDGNAYLYDLNLVALVPGSIPSPGGTNTQTGIAYNSTTNTIFSIDATAGQLFEIDTAGNVLNAFPIASPGGGLMGGMAYDAGTDTLWVDDIVADTYYEFDVTGGPTGNSFASPVGSGVFGNGISHTGTSGIFDVPGGTGGAGQVTDVFRVDSSGNTIDQADVTTTGDTFLNGNVWHAAGSTGLEVNYIMGNATNTIFEVEMTLLLCNHNQILALDCEQAPGPGTTVNLSWTNQDAYDTINVLRDATLVETIAGGSTSYSDDPGAAGTYEYSLETTVGAETCQGAACIVFVTDVVGQAIGAHQGGSALGITIVETTGDVIAVDLFTGDAHTYDRDLLHTGVIPTPGGAAGTTTGIAWDPATGNLFWIDATANTLFETDTAGNLLGGNPITGAGAGLPGGLDLNAGGTALIYNDIADDTYYEIAFTGAGTGLAFVNPALAGPPSATVGAFGNGIAVNVTGDAYDLPVGTDLGVGHFEEVDTAGTPTGNTEDCGPNTFYDDTFINGIVHTTAGPDGQTGSFRYVVGNADDKLYAAATAFTSPCSGSLAGNTDVIWNPGGGFTHEFGDVDSGLTLEADLVAAGRSVIVCKGLPSASELQAAGVQILWATLGTFPDNQPLSERQGQILADLIQSEISVYNESGDEWGFDIPTAMALYDGVEDGTAADGDDSFTSMDGLDTGFINLAVHQDVVYAQDQAGIDYTDQILPTGTDPAIPADLGGTDAQAIWLNNPDALPDPAVVETAYTPAIAYNTTASLGKTISSGFEYGGIDAAVRSQVLDEYLSFLGPGVPPPGQFIRGDVNADGTFNIADPVALLSELFVPGTPPGPCADAGDVNDDGSKNIADAVSALSSLFVPGTPPPPAPHPTCGPDPTADLLDCASFPPCP